MKKLLILFIAAFIHAYNIQAQTDWHITGNAGTNASTNFIGTTDNIAFKIRTNNTVRMTVMPGGNVGIGTAQPKSKLDVAGDITAYSSYFIRSDGAPGVSVGRSGANYGSVGYGLIFTDTTFKYRYNITDFSSMLSFRSGGFDFNTAPSGVAGTTIPYTTAMAILQNGRVGIGTTTPASTLDVNGDALINGLTIGRGGGSIANNVAVGNQALAVNTFTDANTAIGSGAQIRNTDGHGNTAVGYSALDWNVHGSYNTAVGAHINTIISPQSFDNNTTLGSSVFVNANNVARIGNSSVTSIGGQVGWTTFSDERIKQDIKENVPGLKFINLLKPVTYRFSLTTQNELVNRGKDTSKWRGKYDIEKITYSGFLAQAVNKAAKSIDYDFSGVDTAGVIWGLRYSEFVVPLVKAVQELSTENNALKSEIGKLKSEMQKQIDELRSLLNSQNIIAKKQIASSQ